MEEQDRRQDESDAGQDQTDRRVALQTATDDRDTGHDRHQADDQEGQEARLGAGRTEDQQRDEQPVPPRNARVRVQEIDEGQDGGGEQGETEQVRRAEPGDAECLGIEDGRAGPAIRSGHRAEQSDGYSDGTTPPTARQSARRSRRQHDERHEHRQPREPVEQGDRFDAGRPTRRGGLRVEEPVVGEGQPGDIRDLGRHVMTEFPDQGQVIRHIDVRRVGARQVVLREEAADRVDEQEPDHRREGP